MKTDHGKQVKWMNSFWLRFYPTLKVNSNGRIRYLCAIAKMYKKSNLYFMEVIVGG